MNEPLTPNAASPEYVKDMAKAVSLTPNQRYLLCDLGYYNEIIRGYLIRAMQGAGFAHEQIEKALIGLDHAFDDTTAAEAQQGYKDF